MLEWLPGSCWDNEDVRDTVLLIIKRHQCRWCYTGGMLMVFPRQLCLGNHRDLPAAPCGCRALTPCDFNKMTLC